VLDLVLLLVIKFDFKLLHLQLLC